MASRRTPREKAPSSRRKGLSFDSQAGASSMSSIDIPLSGFNGDNALSTSTSPRQSPVPMNRVSMPPPSTDENEDVCASCGLGGDLICCDKCPRSFHFLCSEPPLNKDSLPDEWMCNACVPRKNPFQDGGAKDFVGVLNALLKAPPRVFRLPPGFTDLYSGSGAPSSSSALVAGDKRKRQKTEHVNSEFCHACNGRLNELSVKCDTCVLSYHMDCLSPPLAHAPRNTTWTCPNHPLRLIKDLLEAQRMETALCDEKKFILDFVSFVKKSKASQPAVQNSQKQLHPSLEEIEQFKEGVIALQTQWYIDHALPNVASSSSSCVSNQDGGEPQLPLPFVLEGKVDDLSKEELVDVVRALRSQLVSRFSSRHAPIEDATRVYDSLPIPSSPSSGLHHEGSKRIPTGPTAWQDLLESLQSTPPAPYLLRASGSGEIFFIAKEKFLFGTAPSSDVNLETLQAPFMSSPHHCVLVLNPSTQLHELVNMSEDVVWVDGVECLSSDITATVVRNNSVLEIAGLKFVFMKVGASSA